MAQLTVGNQIFNYPDPGTEAGWGEDATGWASAVTALLAVSISNGDILPTTLNIVNDASSSTNLVGLSFNRSTTRAANVFYHITRQTGNTPSIVEIVESGTLLITAEIASNTTPIFTMSQMKNGDAGVTFAISDSGQISYTSTNLVATPYVGQIKFSAKTLTVV